MAEIEKKSGLQFFFTKYIRYGWYFLYIVHIAVISIKNRSIALYVCVNYIKSDIYITCTTGQVANIYNI